jgi:hypothetical protein
VHAIRFEKNRKSARVDDRRILNAIFYVLRTGMPWRDLPERYGPYTTAYNRSNRWSRRGIWKRVPTAIIIGNLRYVTAPRDDWPAVAAYLRERLQNPDWVLVFPTFNINPLRSYLRIVARTFVVLSRLKPSEIDQLLAKLSGYGREAEHFDALRIAVIEYQRRVRPLMGGHCKACPNGSVTHLRNMANA